MFEEDIEELIKKLNQLGDERAKYKGKIWTNAKGEASFETRVLSDELQEVIDGSDKLVKGLVKICTDNSVPIAGTQ